MKSLKERVADRLTGKDTILSACCGICGNSSGYDDESLKDSTWNINGVKIVLCCPCEDDLKKSLNKPEIKRLKNWIQRLGHTLMSDDLEDLEEILQTLKAKYD